MIVQPMRVLSAIIGSLRSRHAATITCKRTGLKRGVFVFEPLGDVPKVTIDDLRITPDPSDNDLIDVYGSGLVPIERRGS